MVSDFAFAPPRGKLNHPPRYYVPVILLSSSLILVIALIVNNVQRRYPQFWFVPPSPPKKHIALVLENLREEESVIIAGMDKDARTTLPPHPPHLLHLHPSDLQKTVAEKTLDV